MWGQLSKKQKLFRIIMHFFSLFPIDSRKIVVESYFGMGYGDNGKYIIEELQRQVKGYKIVWLIDPKKSGTMPTNIKQVNRETLLALYHLSTAKIWIDNCRKSIYTNKRRGQFYIQTWHGAIGVKKCERDAQKTLSSEYIRDAIHDSKMADLMLSGSKWGTNTIRQSFWYDGDILESGIPRSDIFFKRGNAVKEKVQAYLNKGNVSIVLYAPTFRKDFSMEAYQWDFNKLLAELEKKFLKKFILLVRLHPNMVDKAKELIYSEKVIDVSSYPDMQELMLAAEILISDYSSSPFEFMFSKKPVFLLAKDYEYFVENDRELYFDLRKLPFSLSINEQALFDNIRGFNQEKYEEDLEHFFEKLGIIEEGNASKKIVEIIRQKCGL